MLSEPLSVVAVIAELFDRLGIPYLVGGSLASSSYGVPRATQDADLVADIRVEHVDKIAAGLSADFYVDSEMIREAVARRSSFNVVHLASMFKVDVFVKKADVWAGVEMARARTEQLVLADGEVSIRFASAEDTILHKLSWYKLGGQVSERQWGDILGILRVQSGNLDLDYLADWAGKLGVADLLQVALGKQ